MESKKQVCASRSSIVLLWQIVLPSTLSQNRGHPECGFERQKTQNTRQMSVTHPIEITNVSVYLFAIGKKRSQT